MIDWTISVGNLIQIGVILGGIMTMYYTLRSDVRVLRHDLRYIEHKVETLSEAFTQLGRILTQVAVQDTRLSMIEKNVDELRHGQGFIKKVKESKGQ